VVLLVVQKLSTLYYFTRSLERSALIAKMIDNRDNPCIRQCLCTYTRLEALYYRETIAQKSLVVVEALL
jgi:hypothetical protein